MSLDLCFNCILGRSRPALWVFVPFSSAWLCGILCRDRDAERRARYGGTVSNCATGSCARCSACNALLRGAEDPKPGVITSMACKCHLLFRRIRVRCCGRALMIPCVCVSATCVCVSPQSRCPASTTARGIPPGTPPSSISSTRTSARRTRRRGQQQRTRTWRSTDVTRPWDACVCLCLRVYARRVCVCASH